MISKKYTIIIVCLIFILEIIPIVVYIYNDKRLDSVSENDEFLKKYKEELEKNVKIQYYYIYEFERIFPHHHNYESFQKVERSNKFNFIHYFYFVDAFLWAFAICRLSNSEYVLSFAIFVILEIVTLVGFINTLFLIPTNVNISGIDIYIFEDSFNDTIRKRLEGLYESKVNCLIAEFILLILFIIQMVCINILKKYKKEENILSKSAILKEDEINKNLIE